MSKPFRDIHRAAEMLTVYQKEATKQSGHMTLTGSIQNVYDTGMVAIKEEKTGELVFAYFKPLDRKLLYLNKGDKINVSGTLVIGRHYDLNDPVIIEEVAPKNAYLRLFD